MERKLMIAPSMGCCDLFDMERQVRIIDEKSDFLHMDIKDGVYVPSFGIGPEFLAALKDKVSTPMDAHLMIKHPQQYLETFAKAGAAYITPHTDCIEGDAAPALWNKADDFEEAWAIMENELESELN